MPAAVGDDAVGAKGIVGDETPGTDEAAELPSMVTAVGDKTPLGFLGTVGEGFGADEAVESPFMAAGACADGTVVFPSTLGVFIALAPCRSLLLRTGSYIFLVLSVVW